MHRVHVSSAAPRITRQYRFQKISHVILAHASWRQLQKLPRALKFDISTLIRLGTRLSRSVHSPGLSRRDLGIHII